MELNGVSASISPVRNESIVRPQASPKPSENEPEVTGEEDGGGKANGVISKLNEGDHFKGVAAVRLLISHFDNEGLDKIDPALLAPEDNNGNAYEKFLEQYRALYEASQPPPDPVVPEPELSPAAIVEPLPEPEVPIIEIPAPDHIPVIIEEPVVEVPPTPAEPPAVPLVEEPVNEVPAADSIFVTPLEIEPVATPPATPVDEGEGILTAFEELWDAQALEEKPETLDIVI
jgi:hypothetical protein